MFDNENKEKTAAKRAMIVIIIVFAAVIFFLALFFFHAREADTGNENFGRKIVRETIVGSKGDGSVESQEAPDLKKVWEEISGNAFIKTGDKFDEVLIFSETENEDDNTQIGYGTYECCFIDHEGNLLSSYDTDYRISNDCKYMIMIYEEDVEEQLEFDLSDNKLRIDSDIYELTDRSQFDL